MKWVKCIAWQKKGFDLYDRTWVDNALWLWTGTSVIGRREKNMLKKVHTYLKRTETHGSSSLNLKGLIVRSNLIFCAARCGGNWKENCVLAVGCCSYPFTRGVDDSLKDTEYHVDQTQFTCAFQGNNELRVLYCCSLLGTRGLSNGKRKMCVCSSVIIMKEEETILSDTMGWEYNWRSTLCRWWWKKWMQDEWVGVCKIPKGITS